jgi:hypothetical protein
MPDVPPDEQQRMAEAIDAGLEPRIRVDADLSAEGAQRLRDALLAVSADLMIESSWPLLRMAALLDDALSGP